MLKQIGNEHLAELLADERPALIACIHRDADFQETIEQLEAVAAYLGSAVRVGYILEDLLPYFQERFGVSGTPTYVLIKTGRRQEMFLGKQTAQSLIDSLRPLLAPGAGRSRPKAAPRQRKNARPASRNVAARGRR